MASREPISEATLHARGVRTVLRIGAAFFGAGIIGVVAANLQVDEIGPLVRSVLVALVWLALVALAELARDRGAFASLADPIALLAAIAYGATIFQVTQSLQVPAFEPALILAWAAGSLLYAYASRYAGPLVLGVGALTAWYVWELSERADVTSALVIGLALAAPFATAIAALHDGTARAHFTGAWRLAAALLALGALAVAAVGPLEDSAIPAIALTAAIPACLLSLAAMARGGARRRAEILGALLVAGAAVALVALAPSNGGQDFFFFGDEATGSAVTHRLVAVGILLTVATAIAYLGSIDGAPALTGIGVGAIVLFFASQLFLVAVAPDAASWLLLGLGAALAVCGVVADVVHRRRARA